MPWDFASTEGLGVVNEGTDMNCKPGDLAIAVSAVPDKARNIGAIVRILRLWPGHADSWEVETLTWTVYKGQECPPGSLAKAMDRYLRPLRGDDEVNEDMRRLEVLVA